MKIKTNHLFAFINCLIVFLFFAHTLNFSWKHFDEQIIYNETLFPIPVTFLQISEFLKYFGFRNYIEASNPFYTNIANLRNTPVVLNLFLLWLFKKSAFNYHLFMLIIHTINTFFCFQILNKISSYLDNKESKIKLLLVSLLTLIWALHPTNIESILLPTNFGALITYSFCLFILYFYVNLDLKILKKILLSDSIILFILYLIPLLLNEYSVTLQIILFLYLFSTSLFFKIKHDFKEALFYSFRLTTPLTFALLVFIINFLTLPRISVPEQNDLLVILERIFWLSPQIFFHFMKLIFSPVHLSLDQGTFVKLSNTIFAPYAILCFLFLFGLIFISFLSLVFIRKKWCFYFFVSFVPFILSLLPFLHIVSPIYNLTSERYFYFPTFFLIFGISHVLFDVISAKGKSWHISTGIIISLVFCLFSTRSYFRSLDWKDSINLFSSAFKEAKTDLIRALRLEMLGGVLISVNTNEELRNKGYSYIIHGQNMLEETLKKLKEEKETNNIPVVLKIYGLTHRTTLAKTAYLLSFTKLGLENNFKESYEILKPYMDDLLIFDTQILNYYLDLCFATNNLDNAEEILNEAIKTKISPGLLIANAKIQINKYNNPDMAEKYLKKAFKYFPYDHSVLESLKSFYKLANKENEYAFYSYLHGLRTHSIASLEDAYTVFSKLNNEKMANKALKNIKLLKK